MLVKCSKLDAKLKSIDKSLLVTKHYKSFMAMELRIAVEQRGKFEIIWIGK